MFKFLRVLFAFFFLNIFSAVPVFADYKLLDAIQEFGEKRIVQTSGGNLKAGPLKLHPLLPTKATYDDNILLEKKDAQVRCEKKYHAPGQRTAYHPLPPERTPHPKSQKSYQNK